MAKAKVTATKSAAKKAPTKGKTRKSSNRAKQQTVQERGRLKLLQRWKRYSIIGLALLIFAGIWKGYEQRVDLQLARYGVHKWLEYTSSAGFRFKELLLEGRKLTDPDRVVTAVGLEVGDPLFLVSLEDIRKRLIAIDTVKDAYVSRDLAGKIAVTLIERKPFVLWQHHGRLRVVDEDGIVLLGEKAEEYPYLITMVGEKAPANMERLATFLAADKTLAEQITAAVFVSERRWDIHFANGVQILLPEMNPEDAWKRLAEMQREHNILEQQVQAIDLRIDNRVFITLPDDATTNEAASDV